MPWNTVIPTLIILQENAQGFTGIFGYNPAPGTGNLVYSESVGGGTDPFGNAYLAGTTTYKFQAGLYYALSIGGAGIAAYTASAASGPYTANSFFSFDNIGDVTIVPNGHLLMESGVSNSLYRIVGGRLATEWTYTPVGNTAVSTDIATIQIPANDMNAGDIYEVSFDGGFLLGPTTAETLNFVFTIGGVTTGATNIAGLFAVNASGRLTITLRFCILTAGATGTVVVGGSGEETSGATNFQLSFGNGGSPTVAFAVNTTIANKITLRATWGGAGGAGQSCAINFATFKKITGL
jgi:hypothetical protein